MRLAKKTVGKALQSPITVVKIVRRGQADGERVELRVDLVVDGGL